MPQKLEEYNLTANAGKTEKYEIPRPPVPTVPTPTPAQMEVLIQHKNDKIVWSDLDWLINYTHQPLKIRNQIGGSANH